MVLRAMWAERAFSLPFCIAGTRAAASAHSTVMAAPAYRWGPGNSLPAGGGGGEQWAGVQEGGEGQHEAAGVSAGQVDNASGRVLSTACRAPT